MPELPFSTLSLFCRAGHATIFGFATTTTRQFNRASGTRKNSKNVKISVFKWSSHNEVRQNAITWSVRYGLQTWSRCRGSAVACPALLFRVRLGLENICILYTGRPLIWAMILDHVRTLAFSWVGVFYLKTDCTVQCIVQYRSVFCALTLAFYRSMARYLSSWWDREGEDAVGVAVAVAVVCVMAPVPAGPHKDGALWHRTKGFFLSWSSSKLRAY